MPGIGLRHMRGEAADRAVLAVVIDECRCRCGFGAGGLREHLNVTVCGHASSVPHPPYESPCLSTHNPDTPLMTRSCGGAVRSSVGRCSPTASGTSHWRS